MIYERFRTIRVGLLLAVCSSLGASVQAYQAVPDYRQLRFPELADIRVPEVQTVTLDNGIRLFLLPDNDLPLIKISAVIRVGSVHEPADKIGLATITGAVMRIGGTTTRTGDELDRELESMAASVETKIGLDVGGASVSVLKEDIDTVLAVLADVLMHPAFPEDKVLLAKSQMRSAISRRNDSPEGIGSREFNKLIYGADSVYARQVEYATIDRITRADLVAFHERYFGPNNMMLAVWGDFTLPEMTEKMAKAFAGWQRVEPVPRELPDVRYEYRRTVNLIPQTGINQSSIFLGHLGGRMGDPDYYALSVMNEVLGASFTGRLFKNIRSRQGLAYSIGGSYGMRYCYPGTFSLHCQTKSGNTARAIRALTDEACRIRQEEVTEEELAAAKESYLNSFIFNFDTKSEIVNRMMAYEYYGYPADFLQRTKRGIEAVTRADILRVARAHLHPDQWQLLVVGRPEDFDEPLSVFGPVQQIDIAIPPPGP